MRFYRLLSYKDRNYEQFTGYQVRVGTRNFISLVCVEYNKAVSPAPKFLLQLLIDQSSNTTQYRVPSFAQQTNKEVKCLPTRAWLRSL